MRSGSTWSSNIEHMASLSGARDLRKRKVASRPTLSRQRTLVYGLAGIFAVLAIWQCTEWLHLANPLIVSSPTDVVKAFIRVTSAGELGSAVVSTATLFAVGFGISLLIGIPLGAVLGWYRSINAVADPLISLAYALPRIALIPLVVVCLGPGFAAQVTLVVLLAVFPIIINVASGISTVTEDNLRLARSFLATDMDVLWTIALPGAIPAIISGVRQGVNLGLAGVVVAEYFIGSSGVGGMIFKAGLTLDTSKAIVGALVFGLAALALTLVLQVVEQKFDRWRTS